MEKFNSPLGFRCPLHPSRTIEGVDPNPSSLKHLYCLTCMLESSDPKSSYENIITFPIFLNRAAKHYAVEKEEYKLNVDHSDRCAKLLADKPEVFEEFKKHIENQKKKIEECLEDVKDYVGELLDQRRQECFDMLDSQVMNLETMYEDFERSFQILFPQDQAADQLFPSKDKIDAMFKNLKDVEDLNGFVDKMKQEMEVSKKTLDRMFNKEFKETALNHFKRQYMQTKTQPPRYEINVQDIKDKLKKSLEKHGGFFVFKNPVVLGACELIMTPKYLAVLKEWLPTQHQNFSPNLLYKGARDGISNEIFVNQISQRGPTITLIKCQFVGSDETAVIGGFLDKSWTKSTNYIISHAAFIFSLTLQIKCPILHPKNAALSSTNPLVAFGAGHDISVAPDLTGSMFPSSYCDSVKIIQTAKIENGKADFIVSDIEVYSL